LERAKKAEVAKKSVKEPNNSTYNKTAYFTIWNSFHFPSRNEHVEQNFYSLRQKKTILKMFAQNYKKTAMKLEIQKPTTNQV